MKVEGILHLSSKNISWPTYEYWLNYLFKNKEPCQKWKYPKDFTSQSVINSLFYTSFIGADTGQTHGGDRGGG